MVKYLLTFVAITISTSIIGFLFAWIWVTRREHHADSDSSYISHSIGDSGRTCDPGWDLASAEGTLATIEEMIRTATGWTNLGVEIYNLIQEHKRLREDKEREEDG